MPAKSIFYPILILHLAFPLAGQDISTFVVGVNSQVGFIIPHSEDLKEISNTTPWGLAIDFSKLMNSEKSRVRLL